MSDATAKSALESPLLALHRNSGATIGTWFGCALPDKFSEDWIAEYRSARESVALIDKNYRAYFSLSGADQVRYLNAILTNNVRELQPGRGTIALLLSAQGRIQAELEVYAAQTGLSIVSYAMIREKLIEALEHYIIMDDVQLTDMTDQCADLALEGPSAAGLVRELCGVDLSELEELQRCVVRLSTLPKIPLMLTRRSPGGVPGAEFGVHQTNVTALWTSLQEAAKRVGGGPMGCEALSALRLEQGIPWFGYDFGEKQIPHEAGLQDSHISYTKGCYTGQEIVERVRSRGQVNRVRVLLKFSGAEVPAGGTSLLADGKEIGHVTRAAYSPALQAPIGMGYVRRENSAVGSEAELASGKATVITPPNLHA